LDKKDSGIYYCCHDRRPGRDDDRNFFRTMNKILSNIGAGVLIFAAGFLCHMTYFKPEPVTIVKKETIWKENIVVRPYNELDFDTCKMYLSGYDTGEFKLDILPLKNDWYKITGELQARTAEREVKIEAGQSGNFKFYLGIGCGLMAAGGIGYLIYKIH
jgi:hypothetical protein